jgi:hypothetical protein
MSATFADGLGREYALRITVADLPFLRELGLDLSKPTAAVGEVDRLMVEEPGKLVVVLYKLANPDPMPEEFAAGFDGPALWRGGCALSHAIIDFFPIPSVAAKLRTALERAISPTGPETPSTSSGTAGRSPESPDSTPGDAP